MAALAEAFVRIRPDTSTFRKETEDGVKKNSRGVGSRAGVSIGQNLGGGMRVGLFKSIPGIAKGLVGAFAVVKGIDVFSGFIADAQESAKVSRITENVIRSTGGAAKVTARSVGDLAQAISNKTGADDETVQSGQNMLLTFTNIRNEVGKGNDIFNQASQSVVDLAAAMNNGQVTTDGVKTASIQLGKALNDPIKGVTALRKVGVSFTKQQTDQIKKLVESGHTLDAQKIILRELGKEFGGTAAAAADPMTKLRTILGNVGEDIGTLLLPVINKFANFLGNVAVPALYKVGSAFKVVLGDDGAQGFGEIMDNAFGNTGKFVGFFRTVGEGIRQLVFGFQALIGAFKDGDVTSDGFVGTMEQIGVSARRLFDYIRGTAIPALVSFGGWVVRNRAWLVPLGVGILTIVAAVKTWIAVTKAFAIAQGILNIVLAANPIGIIILAVVGLVAALVTAYKTSATFRRIVDAAFGAVKTAALAVYNWIKQNWPLLLGILLGPIGVAAALIIKNWDKIRAAAAALWSALKNIWRDGVAFVVRIFLDMVSKVLNGAAKAFGWVPGLGGKLKKAASDFNTFKDQVNQSLSGVKDRKVTVTVGLGTSGTGGKNIRFATGGPVFGPGTSTSDSIVARLSKGEHVLTAREVRGLGGHSAVMQMRKMAAAQAPGFAAGGPVGLSVQSQLTGLSALDRSIRAFNAAVDAAARKLAPQVSSAPGIGGGSTRWLPVVLAVLAALGQPGSLAGAVLRRIQFESGGNPNAINLSDSNARAGHPSQGLVQTIPATFFAYAGRYASRGITDPFANIYAGMNYALHRYGSIAAIDPLVRPRGYDAGGWLQPGLTMAVNRTGRAERVRSGAQEDSLLNELRGLRKDLKRLPIAQVDDRYVRRTNRYGNTRDPSGW